MIKCPYCQQEIDKMPETRRKCPHCREWVYPRKSPHTNQRELVTKEKADEFSAYWDAYYKEEMAKQDEARRISMLPENVRKRMEHYLNQMLKGQITRFEVLCTFPESKPGCLERHGKRYNIIEELNNPSLPCPGCELPDCTLLVVL